MVAPSNLRKLRREEESLFTRVPLMLVVFWTCHSKAMITAVSFQKLRVWVQAIHIAMNQTAQRRRRVKNKRRRRGTSVSCRMEAIEFVPPLLHPSTRKPRVPGTPPPGLETVLLFTQG